MSLVRREFNMFSLGKLFGFCAVLVVMVQAEDIEDKMNLTETNWWSEAGKMTGLLVHQCWKTADFGEDLSSADVFLVNLRDCLARRSLLVFDNLIKGAGDVIELTEGVQLVRIANETSSSSSNSSREMSTRFEDWQSEIVRRIVNIFETHSLRLQLKPGSDKFEARRRKGNMMMPLMMFGMMALGMIMIPMGFQFLAVLGGKALLLAKMALLLTSIQGLKKIATSNVNYGLYATSGAGQCKDDPTCGGTLISLHSQVDGVQPPGGGAPDNNDVMFAFDLQDLSHSLGHYDRQWAPPYDNQPEASVTGPQAYTIYKVPENTKPDLLHPLHQTLFPRYDILRKKFTT